MRISNHLGLVSAAVFGVAMSACVADGEMEPGDEQVAVDEAEVTTPQSYSVAIPYSGGLWGQSYDISVGRLCMPGRTRIDHKASRSQGAGHCEALGWASGNANDCTVKVHIGAAPGESGICTVSWRENPANVILFRDNDFQGPSARFDAGAYDVNQLGIGNDQVSSLRVPPGWTVTLFRDAGFWNEFHTYTSDTASVGHFNDQASSMIITRLPGSPN